MRRDLLALALGLAIVVVALYEPVRGFEFVNWDDGVYVFGNEYVREGLTARGIAWAFGTGHFAWHPLAFVSHMVDVEIFGLADPGGHHLTSVLLHAANAALLLFLMWRLTGSVWRSALVAALFALHPLRVESVAWVAERKDVLSSFFGLCALVAYAGYVRAPSRARYFAVALAMALSLLSKTMWVTLPAVLLLLDFWPLRRVDWGGTRWAGLADARALGEPAASPLPRRRPATLVREKLPLLALAIAAALLLIVATEGEQMIVGLDRLPLGDRLAGAFASYLKYLELSVAPHSLAPFYPLARAWSAGAYLTVLLNAVAVLGISFAVLTQLRPRPYLAVGWFWFVGMLVPVIGLVQAGSQGMADRFTYAPTIGLALIAAWGLGELVEGRSEKSGRMDFGARHTMAVSFALAALLGFSVLTRAQLAHWRDSMTLWERTLAISGETFTARRNLAKAHLAAHELEAARDQATIALELVPTGENAGRADTLTTLGAALAGLGEFDTAARHFREALRLHPADRAARENLQKLQAIGALRQAGEGP